MMAPILKPRAALRRLRTLATSWGIWAALRKAIRAFRTNGIAGLRAGLRPPLSPACHLAATGRTMPMTWR